MFKKILTCHHEEKKILTNQKACTQMGIDFDYKGYEPYK